jgi:hypothetical protein
MIAVDEQSVTLYSYYIQTFTKLFHLAHLTVSVACLVTPIRWHHRRRRVCCRLEVDLGKRRICCGASVRQNYREFLGPIQRLKRRISLKISVTWLYNIEYFNVWHPQCLVFHFTDIAVVRVTEYKIAIIIIVIINCTLPLQHPWIQSHPYFLIHSLRAIDHPHCLLFPWLQPWRMEIWSHSLVRKTIMTGVSPEKGGGELLVE